MYINILRKWTRVRGRNEKYIKYEHAFHDKEKQKLDVF